MWQNISKTWQYCVFVKLLFIHAICVWHTKSNALWYGMWRSNENICNRWKTAKLVSLKMKTEKTFNDNDTQTMSLKPIPACFCMECSIGPIRKITDYINGIFNDVVMHFEAIFYFERRSSKHCNTNWYESYSFQSLFRQLFYYWPCIPLYGIGNVSGTCRHFVDLETSHEVHWCTYLYIGDLAARVEKNDQSIDHIPELVNFSFCYLRWLGIRVDVSIDVWCFFLHLASISTQQ